jgi:nucleoside-diphosphate-sugar epimerase
MMASIEEKETKSLPFSKALVTGGAGFIGSHIVERLIRSGCDVVVLDDFTSGRVENLADSATSSRLRTIRGDINDPKLVSQILRDVEVVFHEAALSPTQGNALDPKIARRVNVDGTLNLLKYSTDLQVERFILASTAEVYGNSSVPMTEDMAPSPITVNGWTKLEAERACAQAFAETGLKTTALRYFNVYGRRSKNGVINEFAERLLSFESPIIHGKGLHIRDFVHVEDVATANMLAATSNNSAGRAFNIGSGSHTTIEDLAELESKILLGENILIPLDYKLARKVDIPAVYGEISLTRNELNFVPKYSLEEGLKSYLEWLKSNIALSVKRPIRSR